MMKLGFRVAGCVGEMFLYLCSSVSFLDCNFAYFCFFICWVTVENANHY